MTKTGHLLCRLNVHQWEKWESEFTPLVPICGLDDHLVTDKDLTIETAIRTCKKCGMAQKKTILHW